MLRRASYAGWMVADAAFVLVQPDFVLKSSADLLALLRRYAPRGGLSFKTLKESWPSAGNAIEELEKQGKVLVTRTGGSNEREGQIKAVFLDEIGLSTKVDKGTFQI